MKVEQIYTIMNSVAREVIGESAIVQEDLTNIVDIGQQIIGAGALDNYVKSLVNHIGKVVFVNRPYNGAVPSVMFDAWEFGSVLEKISGELPDVSENQSWSLNDGQDYSNDIYHAPKVSAKFFNDRVTFECDISFTERQVKESFSDATQLNAFYSMIYSNVEKAMTIRIDSLVMRTINNMIANTVMDDYKEVTHPNTWDNTETTKKSGVKAVNLLKLFNTETGGALTADKALTDVGFLKFATKTILSYKDRLARMSTLFNVGKKERFTPMEYLHTVMLSDFVRACDSYLQADTFHDEYTALPNHETVPYWQGSGTDYSFNSVSAINVKTDGKNTVNITGILGVMFDHEALGVSNLDKRVQTHFNPRGEFWNNFYKFDAGYFNDLNENFIVFLVA